MQNKPTTIWEVLDAWDEIIKTETDPMDKDRYIQRRNEAYELGVKQRFHEDRVWMETAVNSIESVWIGRERRREYEEGRKGKSRGSP
jgi:hypothetical protein